jgi:hypothetical protein
MSRNFRKEYDEYHSSPEQKKNRAMRNAARREAERDGKVSKGDGKDVAHKKALINGGGNGKSNLKVQDKAANRGWRKGQSGYKP